MAAPGGEPPGDGAAAGGEAVPAFGRRALLGAAWLSGATLANGAIGALVNVLLARWLGPGPIGQYALAIAVSDLAALLTGWGVDTYLVQAPGEERGRFGTALSFALALAGGFLLLSAAIGAVFAYRGQPLVAALVAGLAVQRAFVLSGSCYAALLQRRLLFGQLALVQLVVGVVEHVAALIIARAGGGAWAMFMRDLLDAAGLLAGASLISRQPFRPGWDAAVARKLRAFGLAVFAGQVGELAAIRRVDSAVLGLVWGTRELAFYEESLKLADVARRVSQPALSQVALPAYARLRRDPARRAATFRDLQAAGLALLLPFVLALLLLPAPLIRLLFGAAWLPAAPMVRAFAAYALLIPLFEHARQLLLSQGQAATVARAKLAQVLVFLPALGLLLPRWGGEGAALAVGAGYLAALVTALLLVRRLHAPAQGMPRRALPPALAAAAAALVVLCPAAAAPTPARLALLLLTYGAVLTVCYRGRIAVWRRDLSPDLSPARGEERGR